MAVIARHDPRVPAISHVGTEAQVPEASSASFLGTLAGRWMIGGESRTLTGFPVGYWYHRQEFNMLCHKTSPFKKTCY